MLLTSFNFCINLCEIIHNLGFYFLNTSADERYYVGKVSFCHQVIFFSLYLYLIMLLFIFFLKRKKFEEERASFYKQQLLTPRKHSTGSRKSKCKLFTVCLFVLFRVVYKLRSDIRGWIVKSVCRETRKQSARPGERQQSRTVDSRPRNHVN